MKRISTLLVIILVSLGLNAQKIDKGIWQIEIGTGIDGSYSWITGGDWNYSLTEDGSLIADDEGTWDEIYSSQSQLNYDLDFTNFSDWEERFLNGVSFGYFIADGWLIGLGLDLSGLHTLDNWSETNSNWYGPTDFEDDKVRWNEFSLGVIPKVRYYMPTARGNALFLEGSFGLGMNSKKAFVEGRIVPGTTDPFGYDVIAYDPLTGTGIVAQPDEDDTWERRVSTFSTSIGVGVGYAFFAFNSREIFSIEPMIGFNINSRTRKIETTTFDESRDETTVRLDEDVLGSMGASFKLKLSFYLGRHFWSH